MAKEIRTGCHWDVHDDSRGRAGHQRLRPGAHPASRKPGRIHQNLYAYAMLNNGWAPLTTYFNPYGTNAENSRIVLYEWDLDGNGLFESDTTNNQGYTSYTYTKARDYTISLRVTSEDGDTATAQTIALGKGSETSSFSYSTDYDAVRRTIFEVLK